MHGLSLFSQFSAITSITGCQGQRAGSAGLEWGRVCVCGGGWVDGRQSVACLHFIYHSLGAVNLYRCLSMTISLLVGLLYMCCFFSFCLLVLLYVYINKWISTLWAMTQDGFMQFWLPGQKNLTKIIQSPPTPAVMCQHKEHQITCEYVVMTEH